MDLFTFCDTLQALEINSESWFMGLMLKQLSQEFANHCKSYWKNNKAEFTKYQVVYPLQKDGQLFIKKPAADVDGKGYPTRHCVPKDNAIAFVQNRIYSALTTLEQVLTVEQNTLNGIYQHIHGSLQYVEIRLREIQSAKANINTFIEDDEDE